MFFETKQIVQQTWQNLATRYPSVELDAFVIMPNHVHGIVIIDDVVCPMGGVGAQFIAPKNAHNKISNGQNDLGVMNYLGVMNHAPTLGQIVRYFKARSARFIHRLGLVVPVWQRNYYERVVRNERELIRLRQYISDNPFRWNEDPENV